MPIFLGGVASSEPAAGGAAYSVDNSCRFNDNDTAYLARTPGGAGNRKTWTFSAWVKRCNLGSTQYLFSAGTAATNYTAVFFDASDKLNVIRVVSSSTDAQKVTTAVHRDPASWYHVVVKMDAANTNLDVYVNGSEVTVFDTTNEPSNIDGVENNTVLHEIGRRSYTAGGTYFDGYMADVVLVDGTALAPTSFGEVNANGVWVPKSVSGLTVGTNGFHLDFANSADIGNDVSGNANDYTPNNLVAADIVSDTPTNNFCVMSPIVNSGCTYDNGGLGITTSVSGPRTGHATFGVGAGKWYWEFLPTTANFNIVGIVSEQSARALWVGSDTEGYGVRVNAGTKLTNDGGGGGVAYGSSYNGSTDIMMVALDLDNSKIWWGKNGTWFASGDPAAGTNEGFASLPNRIWYPAQGADGVRTGVYNFGQAPLSSGGNADDNGYGDFDYAPPSGFLALCTANLGTPTIEDPSAQFDVVTFTGNGTAIGSGGNEISDLSFQPDFVWIKNRDAADQHILTDAVRGATKYISSDGTDIEATAAETLASFDADGFTVGSDVQVNTSTENYVAWCWKANGAGSANADGTISSTVSVNATAGFSIVKYAGSGANATVGHGLGVAPGLIMVKNLDQADSWAVYHQASATDPETDYFYLDTDGGVVDDATFWNDTAPTSSVYSVGTAHNVNASTENYIAYCFSEVDGFSRFGSYIGNGSADGPFVWCGFRPKFIITMRTAGGVSRVMYDIDRPGYNVNQLWMHPDQSLLEQSNSLYAVDFLSNGFKWRGAHTPINGSGSTYLFFAFAEHPFAYARAR